MDPGPAGPDSQLYAEELPVLPTVEIRPAEAGGKCPESRAGINRLTGELNKQLSDAPGDEKTKKQVLKKLVSQKEESLKEKAKSYESGETFKF